MSAKSGLWKRFKSHKGGNVAIIFGISALFLVAVTGGAIDFSRINDARNKMQDAADIAVLRGALTASQGTVISEKAADQAWTDNFSDADVTWPTTDHTGTLVKTVTGNVSKLNYTATATIAPIFLGEIIGKTKTLTVSSSAQSEVNPFELALVLDVTGSMNQSSKLTNLKSSVTSVLNSLLDANGQNSSKVKVGVVPFNTQVRMPVSTTNAYVDYTECSTTAGTVTGSATESSVTNLYYACQTAYKAYNLVCSSAATANQSSCMSKAASKMYYKTGTSNGTTYYYIQTIGYETVSGKYNFYTQTLVTYLSGGKLVVYSQSNTPKLKQSSTSTYTNFTASGYTLFSPIQTAFASSWKGCVDDRGQSYDVSASPYETGVLDSAYQAADCDNTASNPTLTTIQDMTTSISDTKTYVSKLVAGGSTNITVGVQMGMELLSPDAPYTQGVQWNDPDMDKYMIVVTDGENTANRWYLESANKSSLIDARTALACQAAKDKGITVFVVRVMEGNSDMLQKCASKTIYYYDLKTASQLSAAMSDIFLRIGKLRIVQ